MRRLLPVLLLIAIPAFSEGLTKRERDFAMSALHASRKVFLDTVDGVSKAQWEFKPAPDRWSIAEIAEHLAATTPFLFQTATEKLPKGEVKQRPGEAEDQKVLDRMRDRSQRASAPAELQPESRYKSQEEAVKAFKEGIDRVVRYVETTDQDLRARQGQNGMDGYQYVLMIAGHIDRHVLQMQEVKADPRYPKR